MENKRDYFRINLFNVKIKVKYGEKQVIARIRDVSGNGISVYTKEPLDADHLYVLQFSLNEQNFVFDGRLVRAEEKRMDELVYAFQYEKNQKKQQELLLAVLFQIDIKRNS